MDITYENITAPIKFEYDRALGLFYLEAEYAIYGSVEVSEYVNRGVSHIGNVDFCIEGTVIVDMAISFEDTTREPEDGFDITNVDFTYNMDSLVWVKALAEEVNPKAESPLLKLKKEIIGMTDLVVRSNSFYCNMHHELEDMAGEIEVVDRNDNVHRYLIPIVYCRSCNVYYVFGRNISGTKEEWAY